VVRVAFFLVVLALIAVAVAQPDPPCERPPDLCVDPNCYCLYEWIGPKVQHSDWRLRDIYYGSYHDVEAWLPTPVIFQYPCEVCFVTIQGPGTTFIDEDTKVNRMTIGGRQWDSTNVFLGGVGRGEVDVDAVDPEDPTVILTIGYDDIPVIKRVDAVRLNNGETCLTITGKGFGFCAEDLEITVRDTEWDRDIWDQYDSIDCPYPEGCDYPGIPSVVDVPGVTYDCTNIQVVYLDQRITCIVRIPDLSPTELEVTVQVNVRSPPLFDTIEFLKTYTK